MFYIFCTVNFTHPAHFIPQQLFLHILKTERKVSQKLKMYLSFHGLGLSCVYLGEVDSGSQLEDVP